MRDLRTGMTATCRLAAASKQDDHVKPRDTNSPAPYPGRFTPELRAVGSGPLQPENDVLSA